jgi:hypothetical protein
MERSEARLLRIPQGLSRRPLSVAEPNIDWWRGILPCTAGRAGRGIGFQPGADRRLSDGSVRTSRRAQLEADAGIFVGEGRYPRGPHGKGLRAFVRGPEIRGASEGLSRRRLRNRPNAVLCLQCRLAAADVVLDRSLVGRGRGSRRHPGRGKRGTADADQSCSQVLTDVIGTLACHAASKETRYFSIALAAMPHLAAN